MGLGFSARRKSAHLHERMIQFRMVLQWTRNGTSMGEPGSAKFARFGAAKRGAHPCIRRSSLGHTVFRVCAIRCIKSGSSGTIEQSNLINQKDRKSKRAAAK